MVESPAIKHQLLFWLLWATNSVSQKQGVSERAECGVEAGNLALYQVKDATQILYVSPVALQVSKLWRIPSADLANTIAQELYYSLRSHRSESEQNFSIKVVPPGWIHLQLSDAAISAWLQGLAEAPSWGRREREEGEGGGRREEGRGKRGRGAKLPIFAAQYAHARCCSLLRLAHREGAIVLKEPDVENSPTHWCFVSPSPIPWLTSDKKLRLVDSAERSLISQLVAGVDSLYCPSPSGRQVSWEKTALDLSQTFERFYSRCRMWGEVKTEDPSLVQARLGLLAVTQSFLRLLLQERLGVGAPLEL